MNILPLDKSLRQWLEKYNIPPVPDERVLDSYRVPLRPGDDPDRVREINSMFGGSGEQYNGKEDAFEEACTIMDNYNEFLNSCKTIYRENGQILSRLRPSKETMDGSKQVLTRFPFCAEAYRAMGMVFKEEGIMRRALLCFKHCLECYGITDPDLVQQRVDTDWGYVDQRPYFRSLFSYAECLKLSGDYSSAIDAYKTILRLVPGDNMGVRFILFYLLIRKGDYKDAKKLAKEHKMQDGAPYLTGMILMNFVEYNKGYISEDKMKMTVVKALEENPFVIQYTSLEMNQDLPPRPSYYTMSGRSHAISIAHELRDVFHKIVGLSHWIESTIHEGGSKPTTGKEMFDLLNKGNILIMTKKDGEMVVTTDVSIMRGTGMSEFRVPKGTKEYNEATGKILMFVNGADDNQNTNWISLKLDDIDQVPFWKSILMYGSSNGYNMCNECYEQGASQVCSACKAVRYCNRECQKKHWRAGHRNSCKRLTKT